MLQKNHCRRVTILCLTTVFLIASIAPLAVAQRAQPTSKQPKEAAPKLVLLIVVDQFRYDYLDRFGNLFGPSGIRRLLRDGGSWTDANYDHVPTYTAPGHATMMTGAWPAETGIVANEWPDRETGRIVSNCSDPEDMTGKTRWTALGGAPDEPGRAPRRLMASTLGVGLRPATNGRS